MFRSVAGAAAIVILLSMVLLLHTGCAYKCTTTFIIRNSSSRSIVIKTSEGGYGSDEVEFTLGPRQQRNLLVGKEKCPVNYIPQDKYYDGDMVPPPNLLGILEIWVAEKPLSDDVRLHEIWSYFSTDYTEKYTLDITDEIIASYLED